MLRRGPLLLAIWVLATAAGLWVAWNTKVGPVVLVIDAHQGVHLGDLIGLVVAYAWATVLSMAVIGAPRK